MRVSRHTVGDCGQLAKDLSARCCGVTIPAGSTIEVWSQESPNRVVVAIEPTKVFLSCGHTFVPPHGMAYEVLLEQIRAMPKSGPLSEMGTLPQARTAHIVKLTSVWFEGEAQ